MNAAQKERIMDKIAGMSYDTRRNAYFKWLEIRSHASGKVDTSKIDDDTLANGDGVFWSWQPTEDRLFIKAPVAVLDALEVIDELQALPFTRENGDC